MKVKQEKITFDSGRLTLEGRLVMPGAGTEVPGVVLCHPHPLYGGNMNNNVIYTIARALTGKGMASLRFNFRGVGLSEGAYSEGVEEVDDALAAVAFLADCAGVDNTAIGLLGYSFGGAVALKAAMRSDTVKAVAAVSPAEIPLLPIDKPRLVISGSKDDLIPPARIISVENSIVSGGIGTLKILPGADHFWHGYEQELAESIAYFFTQHLGWERQPLDAV